MYRGDTSDRNRVLSNSKLTHKFETVKSVEVTKHLKTRLEAEPKLEYYNSVKDFVWGAQMRCGNAISVSVKPPIDGLMILILKDCDWNGLQKTTIIDLY